MARSLEEIKRDPDDLSLHNRIIRLSAGIAEWKVRKHKAGNTTLLDDISRRAYHDS